MKVIMFLISVFIGIIIGPMIFLSLQDFRFRKKRFIIQLKAYTIGNEDFTISLCKAKNKDELVSFLCMHGYMQHRKVCYARKVLHQIQHVQNMTEVIVGLIMIYDLHGSMIPSQGQIQQEIDKFVANIEHFNNFIKQSKVAVYDDFDDMARELKKANQPILDNLAVIRNEIIDIPK